MLYYPEPYFKNIGNIGNLHLDYIFAEYDCPILFTCYDDDKNLYLCDCVSMTNIQKWLVARIDTDQLYKFINNKISIRNMFVTKDSVYVLTWHYGDKFENYNEVKGSSLTEDELPPAETFLEADDGEFDNYYNIVLNRVYTNEFMNRGKLITNESTPLTNALKLYYNENHVNEVNSEPLAKTYNNNITFHLSTKTTSKKDQSSLFNFLYSQTTYQRQINFV